MTGHCLRPAHCFEFPAPSLRRSSLALLCLGLLHAGSLAAPAAQQGVALPGVPPAQELVKLVRPTHPRLLVTNLQEFAALKQRIAADPQLEQWYRALKQQGQEMLGAPPPHYGAGDAAVPNYRFFGLSGR